MFELNQKVLSNIRVRRSRLNPMQQETYIYIHPLACAAGCKGSCKTSCKTTCRGQAKASRWKK